MSTITIRTDHEVDRALAELMADGRDRSTAIREAILAAWRSRQAERLRVESAALAVDPVDVAEARAVLAEMDALRAW